MASIHGEDGRFEFQSSDSTAAPASPPALHQKQGILEDAPSQAQKRFDKAWRRMLDLRGEVTQARLTLREMAARLEDPKSRLRSLNAKLYDIWQYHWNSATEPDRDDLTKLYKSIQKVLDEVGPLEEHYNEKEDDLHLLEYRLGEIEERVYSRAVAVDPRSSSSASSLISSSIKEEPSSYSDMTSYNSKHDDVQRYLDRVGDANIVRERIAQLQQDRDQYAETAKQRAFIGVPQYQPNVEFLEDFDDVFESHMQELNTINQDIRRLAVSADIEVPTSPATEIAVIETDDPIPIAMRATWPLTSEVPKETKPKRSFSYDDLSELRKNDKINLRERVNSWLLERLRTSKLARLLDSPHIQPNERWDAIVHSWPRENEYPTSSPPSTMTSETQRRSSPTKPHIRSNAGIETANPFYHRKVDQTALDQSRVTDFRTSNPKFLRSLQLGEDADWDCMSDFETSRSQ